MAACGFLRGEEEEQKFEGRKRMFNFKPAGKRNKKMKSLAVSGEWGPERNAKEHKENVKVMTALDEEEWAKQCLAACDTWETDITKAELAKLGVQHDADVKIYLSKPKGLPRTGNPCVIYCHGGGQCVGTAKSYRAVCNLYALRWNCVIVNLEYRLAPEHKNKGYTDLYATVKALAADPDSYQIDPKRICMKGASGGAHTVMACANLLVQKGEQKLVKLCWYSIPMFGYHICTLPLDKLTQEEKDIREVQICMYKLIGDGGIRDTPVYDAAVKTRDTKLFPGQIDDATIKKHPLALFTTAEFCMYNSAVQPLSKRFEKAGRLAEIILVPGVGHMFQQNWEVKATKIASDAEDKCVAVYLRGESQ